MGNDGSDDPSADCGAEDQIGVSSFVNTPGISDEVIIAPKTSIDLDRQLARLWTVPNVISFLRLAGIAVFAWVLLGDHARLTSAILLAALGATDWIDGYIARRFDQVSTLGKIIDPVADRVLFLVGVSCILAVGSAPLWVGITVLTREALVSSATIIVAMLGGRRIDVIWAGKAGTFALMIAFPAFLLAHSGVIWSYGWEDVAWVSAIAGLALGWFAALSYIPLAIRAMSEGKPGSAGSAEALGSGS